MKNYFTRIGRASVFAIFLGLPLIAGATVDAMITYVFLRSAIQTEGYCEQNLPMMAEFGLPADPYLQGLFAPARIAHHSIGNPLSFQNMNVLAQQGITYKLVSESYRESDESWDYRMTLDFSNLTQKANTRQKRADVLTKAKLAIIGMNANLERALGRYRLYLQVLNLPSQQDVSGSRVYKETTHPYTSSSPLLATYRQELINVEGECD